MVMGLDLFKKHFREYQDQYVLIGGTASTVVMEEAGLDFRATKDLDIVLCIEVFNADFAGAFWDFVNKGKYSNKQYSTGKRLFYRFHTPEEPGYPFMLELFSRIPDFLHIDSEKNHLTPIPVEDEISSLSAILLESEYYDFIHDNKIIVNNLPVIGPEILIPLKARAWIDLTHRKNAGEKIDSRNIRKQKNDILRLFPLIPGEAVIHTPDEIKGHVAEFLDGLSKDKQLQLKSLGIRSLSVEEIVARIKAVYGIDG